MPSSDLILIISGFFPDMIESLDCLREGARSGVRAHLDRAEAMALRIHLSEQSMARLTGHSEETDASLYVSIPGHIGRISGYLQVIASALKVKHRDDVLFSEKAMDEVDLLFAQLRELMELALAAVSGISGISAVSGIIGNQAGSAADVARAASGIETSAGKFLGLHEERLLEGLCLPKASSIYLEMVDGFKAISWHLREIALKTTANS